MTNKDYELIARAIKLAHERCDGYPDTRAEQERGVLLVAEALVSPLEADNPRFDADRFAAACGPL